MLVPPVGICVRYPVDAEIAVCPPYVTKVSLCIALYCTDIPKKTHVKGAFNLPNNNNVYKKKVYQQAQGCTCDKRTTLKPWSVEEKMRIFFIAVLLTKSIRVLSKSRKHAGSKCLRLFVERPVLFTHKEESSDREML
jgi:hypothetical protein